MPTSSAGDVSPPSGDAGQAGGPDAAAGFAHVPPIPRASWIVRVLVPAGDIWRAEKPIRALGTLPAIGDAIALEDGGAGRVAGVCSPAMSGVHADIYAAPLAGGG